MVVVVTTYIIGGLLETRHGKEATYTVSGAEGTGEELQDDLGLDRWPVMKQFHRLSRLCGVLPSYGEQESGQSL